jgi:amino acid transporter
VVFYAVFNSGTNSMQTGRMVLQFVDAAQNRTESFAPGWARDNGPHDVHRDLVRFIGVFVLLVICLLQYFSPGFGRKLNKAFAVMKILFLVALIAVAADARKYPLEGADGKQLDRSADWGEEYGDRKPLLFAKAFLAVLFSFEGWENATFVGHHFLLPEGATPF